MIQPTKENTQKPTTKAAKSKGENTRKAIMKHYEKTMRTVRKQSDRMSLPPPQDLHRYSCSQWDIRTENNLEKLKIGIILSFASKFWQIFHMHEYLVIMWVRLVRLRQIDIWNTHKEWSSTILAKNNDMPKQKCTGESKCDKIDSNLICCFLSAEDCLLVRGQDGAAATLGLSQSRSLFRCSF